MDLLIKLGTVLLFLIILGIAIRAVTLMAVLIYCYIDDRSIKREIKKLQKQETKKSNTTDQKWLVVFLYSFLSMGRTPVRVCS